MTQIKTLLVVHTHTHTHISSFLCHTSNWDKYLYNLDVWFNATCVPSMYLNSDVFKLSGDFHFNNYGFTNGHNVTSSKTNGIMVLVIVSTCAMCLINEGIICHELNVSNIKRLHVSQCI